MVVADARLTTPGAIEVPSDELRERYGAYCRAEAARLVHLLPRAAVRPLYRRARAAATRAGALERGEGSDDPMRLLVEFAETILPLPPFDVWLDDLTRHPEAHQEYLNQIGAGPTADAPATMVVRSFRHSGRSWRAHLRSFEEGGLWRAHIAFEEVDTGRVHRTASVFCEADPDALQERFLGFESSALTAFLRSVLP